MIVDSIIISKVEHSSLADLGTNKKKLIVMVVAGLTMTRILINYVECRLPAIQGKYFFEGWIPFVNGMCTKAPALVTRVIDNNLCNIDG